MNATQDATFFPQKRHTRKEWLAKFYDCEQECWYCQLPLTLETATKDHRTPTCRGGSDEISNIVPACLGCNQMKAWRTEAEFVEARPSLISTRARRIGCIDKPKPSVLSPEEANEPGLLKRIMSERDGMRASWAWRNPA
jgi:HNH endonuclease